MNKTKINYQFIYDIVFAKEVVKILMDTVFEYYPKKYADILPHLHKAYDELSLSLYRIESAKDISKRWLNDL